MSKINPAVLDSMLIASPHIFYIYDSRGRVRRDIKRAFLKTEQVSHLDLEFEQIPLEGADWAIKCTEATYAHIDNAYSPVPCIASFQELKSGKKIVVLRLLKDKDHGINI